MEIKTGQKVKISKRTCKFFSDNAFGLNNKMGVLEDEESALSYLTDKLLGANYPYIAKTGIFYQNCGDGPGYMVHIKFKGGFKMSTIIEVKDLRVVK